MRIFILVVVTFTLTAKTIAQTAILDKNFGNNGVVITDFLKSSMQKEFGKQVLQQKDGKVLVIFSAFSGTTISRYSSNGVLDESFGHTGYSQSIASHFIFQRGVILKDGSILLGGTNDGNFAFIRFYKDGILDKEFGNKGLLISDFGNLETLGSVDANGDNIIAIGSTLSAKGRQLAVVSLKNNGKLDKKFGNNGKLVLSFGSFEHTANALSIQSDNTILIAGSVIDGGVSKGFLARLSSKGSLDRSFGTNGVSLISSGPISSLAIQKDGKIVALDNEVLLRFTNKGFLDSTFGVEGKQQLHSTKNPVGLYVQDDSKIVVAGTYIFGTIVTRYNTDGSHDPTYGWYFGSAYIDVRRSAYPSSLIIQKDGKALVTGYNAPVASGTQYYLFRLTESGSLDMSFESKGLGIYTDHYFVNYASFEKIAVLKDGRILAAGKSGPTNSFGGSFNSLVASRYLANGTLDTSFADMGKLILQTNAFGIGAVSLSVKQDGGFIIGANAQLFSYDKNGDIEPGFGELGVVTTPISINSISILSNGKIILLGDDKLCRLNSNGTLDAGFGVNGVLELNIYPYTAYSLTPSFVIQKDQKILLSGQAWNGVSSDRFLVRLNPDGTMDNSFDGDGKMILNLNNKDFSISALAVQQDGKIIGGGSAIVNGRDVFALVRITTSGAIDNTFGTLGIQYADFEVPANANSISIHDNGEIFLGGIIYKSSHTDIGVAAFTKEGTLDKTFGDNGKVVTDLGFSNEKVFALAIGNNRLFAAGETSAQNLKSALIASYTISAQTEKNPQIVNTNKVIDQVIGGLKVIVLSNPSIRYFTLQLQGAGNESVKLKITDIAGKVIRQQQNINVNTTLQFGHDYLPGTYLAEVIQGTERIVVKLIKQ